GSFWRDGGQRGKPLRRRPEQQLDKKGYGSRGRNDIGRRGQRQRGRNRERRAVQIPASPGGGQHRQRLCGGQRQLRNSESDADGRGDDAGRTGGRSRQRGRDRQRRAVLLAFRRSSG